MLEIFFFQFIKSLYYRRSYKEVVSQFITLDIFMLVELKLCTNYSLILFVDVACMMYPKNI